MRSHGNRTFSFEILCGIGGAMPDTANEKLKALVNGRYSGLVRFRASIASYLSYSRTVSTSPDAWTLKQNPSLGGYWIFRTDAYQCLQDNMREYFVMSWWNLDGHGVAPQDWETFSVELAGENGDAVVLKSYVQAYVAPSSVGQNNSSPVLYCDHQKSSATRFEVEFL